MSGYLSELPSAPNLLFISLCNRDIAVQERLPVNTAVLLKDLCRTKKKTLSRSVSDKTVMGTQRLFVLRSPSWLAHREAPGNLQSIHSLETVAAQGGGGKWHKAKTEGRAEHTTNSLAV